MVGTAVFGDMLGAFLVGIFPIPMLYVVMQRICEKVHGTTDATPAVPESPAPAESHG